MKIFLLKWGLRNLYQKKKKFKPEIKPMTENLQGKLNQANKKQSKLKYCCQL